MFFWGSSLRSSFSTSDSVTACREKVCSGQGKKREERRVVTFEGVGDEEMLDGQGGMAESHRTRLNEVVIFKELSHVLLVSNNHINIK